MDEESWMILGWRTENRNRLAIFKEVLGRLLRRIETGRAVVSLVTGFYLFGSWRSYPYQCWWSSRRSEGISRSSEPKAREWLEVPYSLHDRLQPCRHPRGKPKINLPTVPEPCFESSIVIRIRKQFQFWTGWYIPGRKEAPDIFWTKELIHWWNLARSLSKFQINRNVQFLLRVNEGKVSSFSQLENLKEPVKTCRDKKRRKWERSNVLKALGFLLLLPFPAYWSIIQSLKGGG